MKKIGLCLIALFLMPSILKGCTGSEPAFQMDQGKIMIENDLSI